MHCEPPEALAVIGQQRTKISAAQTVRLVQYRIEHWREVIAGVVDDREDLSRGRLLLVGLMQLGGQPSDRLVRSLGKRARRNGKQTHRGLRGCERRYTTAIPCRRRVARSLISYRLYHRNQRKRGSSGPEY